MKKLYIIPGWEETVEEDRYKKLALMAEGKGYEVVGKNINWNQKLSEQVFDIEGDSVIFGFSLGAILAHLIAQRYSCEHLILASMTPFSSFSDDKETRKELVDIVGTDFVNDVESHLTENHKAKKKTIMYGDQEEEIADVLVPNTNHEINDLYINEVSKLI